MKVGDITVIARDIVVYICEGVEYLHTCVVILRAVGMHFGDVAVNGSDIAVNLCELSVCVCEVVTCAKLLCAWGVIISRLMSCDELPLRMRGTRLSPFWNADDMLVGFGIELQTVCVNSLNMCGNSGASVVNSGCRGDLLRYGDGHRWQCVDL
jgi:hypothetical protein